MKTKLLTLLFILVSPCLLAQEVPKLEGPAFRDWIRQTYYTNYNQFSYRQARLHLYNTIDNKDGLLRGVYSGFTKEVQDISKPGDAMPINCEHTIPQSFFDKKLPMVSDMHHLFPTYVKWNGRRSNYPFGEIPDDQTQYWMIDDQRSSDIPSANIDAYSEFANKLFEPAEAHKGNLARAVLYFFTMYPESTELEKVGNLETFILWHMLDPVDQAERDRNDAIESFQGNRNPYIDHPEWVFSAWPLEGASSDQSFKRMAYWHLPEISDKQSIVKYDSSLQAFWNGVQPDFLFITGIPKRSIAKKLCKNWGWKGASLTFVKDGETPLAYISDYKTRKEKNGANGYHGFRFHSNSQNLWVLSLPGMKEMAPRTSQLFVLLYEFEDGKKLWTSDNSTPEFLKTKSNFGFYYFPAIVIKRNSK